MDISWKKKLFLREPEKMNFIRKIVFTVKEWTLKGNRKLFNEQNWQVLEWLSSEENKKENKGIKTRRKYCDDSGCRKCK